MMDDFFAEHSYDLPGVSTTETMLIDTAPS
jgi:hypothetical protein